MTSTRCCVLLCALKLLGVLVESDDGSGKLIIDYRGLVYSFMMSVGNESIWTPVIETATKTCYDQFAGSDEGLFCGSLFGTQTSFKHQLKHWFFQTLFQSMFWRLSIVSTSKTTPDARPLIRTQLADTPWAMSKNAWEAKIEAASFAFGRFWE
jgi:hypothetical protein